MISHLSWSVPLQTLENTSCISYSVYSEGFRQCFQRRYETEFEFALKIWLLSAMNFVSTQDVVDSFDFLDCNNMPEKAQGVIHYFVNWFIVHPQRCMWCQMHLLPTKVKLSWIIKASSAEDKLLNWRGELFY